MRTSFENLIADWSFVLIPVAVFVFSTIALLWLRMLGFSYLKKRMHSTRKADISLIITSLRIPTFIFCLILSLYLGVTVSTIPPNWKLFAGNILWSLFVLAVAVILIYVARNLINFYGRRFNAPGTGTNVISNIVRILILVIGLLIILGIWNVRTTPLLLLMAVILVITALLLRNVIPNLFGAFQISATHDIEIGDYIKIETGEEGLVQNINWRNTQLKQIDSGLIIVPNKNILGKKIINYGRPVKEAEEPFYFNTRLKLGELTGVKAANLSELVDKLRDMPDTVTYYHTHHYIEEHQYLIPELSNDFANWVRNALGNDRLAEKLASINTYEFTSLYDLRDKIVQTIDDNIKSDSNQRQAMSGMEFHFMKSVTVILPTKYVAHNLREFLEALRRVNPGALYYHMFESKLRLGKEMNDFSIWLETSMGETELSREIARIDPYSYTLEGLRSKLVQIIEKRII